MRNYFFLIIILFMMMILSCSKTLTVQGRVFAVNDQYKSTSLEFINDTVCIYTQELHCGVSDQYRKKVITCLYEVINSNIVLKNINYHPDSLYTYFELPEEEKNNCEFIKKDIDQVIEKAKGFLVNYGSSVFEMHYGYLNNVGIDTLAYTDNCIYYSKFIAYDYGYILSNIFVDKNYLQKLKNKKFRVRQPLYGGKIPMNIDMTKPKQ